LLDLYSSCSNTDTMPVVGMQSRTCKCCRFPPPRQPDYRIRAGQVGSREPLAFSCPPGRSEADGRIAIDIGAGCNSGMPEAAVGSAPDAPGKWRGWVPTGARYLSSLPPWGHAGNGIHQQQHFHSREAACPFSMIVCATPGCFCNPSSEPSISRMPGCFPIIPLTRIRDNTPESIVSPIFI
jgi:hypothetical protein